MELYGVVRIRPLSGVSSNRLSSRLGFIIVGSVDRNLDGDLAPTDFFASKMFDSFLLLLLATDIDKAIALAFPGLSPTPAYNAGGDDFDAGFGEDGREGSIIDIEAKIGNEEHSGGGFTSWVLTFSTGRALDLGLANTRSLFGSGLGGGLLASGSRGSSFDDFAVLSLALRFALGDNQDQLCGGRILGMNIPCCSSSFSSA